MQAGTCLLPRMNCDVAVMCHIPPPSRSPSFEVPAVFHLREGHFCQCKSPFIVLSTMSVI